MRALLPGPLYHSAPNLYATQTLLLEDALLVLEPRFDAERTLALIERHRLSHAYLVPTMFVRMLKLPDEVRRRYDLSSLRFVATTGSPCAPAVKRAMIDWWGPVLHECYASSEAGVIPSIDSHEALKKPGPGGRPAPRRAIINAQTSAAATRIAYSRAASANCRLRYGVDHGGPGLLEAPGTRGPARPHARAGRRRDVGWACQGRCGHRGQRPVARLTAGPRHRAVITGCGVAVSARPLPSVRGPTG